MSFRQKKSHYDYHPLPREQGEPDAMDTIKLLPQVPRDKLMKLFDVGTLRSGDLDHKSVMTLQQLSESLQVCFKTLIKCIIYFIVAQSH